MMAFQGTWAKGAPAFRSQHRQKKWYTPILILLSQRASAVQAHIFLRFFYYYSSLEELYVPYNPLRPKDWFRGERPSCYIYHIK